MTESSRIDQTLAKIAYTAKWTGIPLEKRKGYNKYHVWYIFNFIWLNLDVSGAIYWFIDGAKRGESLTLLTYISPCITISYLANFKSLCIIFYEDYLHELITTLRSLETNEERRQRTTEKDTMIEREVKYLHFVLKFLNFFNWVALVAFPLMPLTLSVLNYVNTKKFNPLLPFLIIYPFDAYDVKIWPFIYVKQIWSEIIVVIELACVDFIFFICSSYIRIQFKLLAFEIEKLVPEWGRHASESEDQTEFKTTIKDLVKWHQLLYHSVDLLEIIYSKSTLLNFVSSSALLCLTGFNVTTIEDKAFVTSFLTFLFMSLLQIYFLCLFGDMLMEASVEVSDSVYGCNWYLAEPETAKMLLFILTRAQKSCKMTALGYADVNLHSFTKILSTAYSYFALLRTMYSSPH